MHVEHSVCADSCANANQLTSQVVLRGKAQRWQAWRLRLNAASQSARWREQFCADIDKASTKPVPATVSLALCRGESPLCYLLSLNIYSPYSGRLGTHYTLHIRVDCFYMLLLCIKRDIAAGLLKSARRVACMTIQCAARSLIN